MEKIMFLGGSIKLQGPEFEKKSVTFESDISGEFHLETKKAAQLAIGDFNVWVQMDKDVVKFKTDVQENDGDIADDIYIVMNSDDKETGLTISLSPKQAITLRQILDHYVAAYYAKIALMTEQTAEGK